MTPPGPARTRQGGTVRSSAVERLLDRHVGRAVLGAIGLLRRRRPMPPDPRHVGIAVFGAIGDTLLVSALILDLRRALPHARLTLVTTATNRIVAPLLPALDATLTVTPKRPDQGARVIRAAQFDVLIDCNQWLRTSALQAAMAGCFTVGFRTKGQGRHFAYDRTADHLNSRHELENYRALLTVIGIDAAASPAVNIPADAHAAVAPLLAGDGGDSSRGLIVFHPWAGGSNAALKEWPLENWIGLGAALQAEGYRLAITGGPVDVPHSDELVALGRQAGVSFLSLAGAIPFGQVAALLAGAAAVVSVNTGVMHLAATVDARLVALNGPTNPLRWGPLSANAVSLTPVGVPGGYLHLGFEYPKGAPDCMAAISPDTVLRSVLHVLAQRQHHPVPVPAA